MFSCAEQVLSTWRFFTLIKNMRKDTILTDYPLWEQFCSTQVTLQWEGGNCGANDLYLTSKGKGASFFQTEKLTLMCLSYFSSRCLSRLASQWLFPPATPTRWVKTSWCTPALWARAEAPGRASRSPGCSSTSPTLHRPQSTWAQRWTPLLTLTRAQVLLWWWSPSMLTGLSTR